MAHGNTLTFDREILLLLLCKIQASTVLSVTDIHTHIMFYESSNITQGFENQPRQPIEPKT